MCQTPDWSLGDRYLRENAPELAPLIDKYSPCPLKAQPLEQYFTILLTGIVAQQLPPNVSQELMGKLESLTGKPITPQAILQLADEQCFEIGLQAQKVGYIKNFATAVAEGQIVMEKFADMTDSQITKQLLQIRGLGQWTIEMFLLLGLCRTDVAPGADYIFKKELKELLQLPEMPKRNAINKATEAWRPWRSLAVWYLWQKAAENQ
ncbi:DNA-3-methyladenine glycosylase family protein [Phascolarctobacterium sp.]|uniref:DNA-3-methyladenine glycosylase family protein n=1 Tax=Phascolarctobacterium sp. TaxID=2049039 RepID=UPI0038694998